MSSRFICAWRAGRAWRRLNKESAKSTASFTRSFRRRTWRTQLWRNRSGWRRSCGAAQRPPRQAARRIRRRGGVHSGAGALHRVARHARRGGGNAARGHRLGGVPGRRLGHRMPGASGGCDGGFHGHLEPRRGPPANRRTGVDDAQFWRTLGPSPGAAGPRVAFSLALGETLLGIAWLWRLSRCAIGE